MHEQNKNIIAKDDMLESGFDSTGVTTWIVVELLNNTNYERWGCNMMILIAGKGLTFIVDRTKEYPASEAPMTGTMASLMKEQLKWKSRDVMAKALLASYIEPHFHHKYWGCESAKMMWSTVRKDQKKNRAEYFHCINDDI
ncbi:hypothetical protein L873DRAFT_1115210 [Choiromyces venosus 120613-1]|uniref:Retrotransposon Copia-like N-terminal domain-containing protein n=1 Tax=Choiromyces venosus 120613-1 TaxID=1336337 RepID=A0A3N4JV63_9PEZI|nr:hypothetical protein L873DRAFT_1115210 [Choiromyces venosus 120613-1]